MDKIVKFSEVVKSSEKVNESHIDDVIYSTIINTPEYKELYKKVSDLVDDFRAFLEDSEVGFDEGDNDHEMALNLALSELLGDGEGEWNTFG